MALDLQQLHQYLKGKDQEDAARPKAFFVQRLGGLGDVIMALSAIHALRVQHPDCKIYLLTESRYADLARHSPHVDGVISSYLKWNVLLHEHSMKKFLVRLVDLNPVNYGINRDHQVNAYLLEMGIHAPSADKRAVVTLPENIRRRSEAKLKSLLASAQSCRILLHPGQGDKNRTWPAERWEHLAVLVLAAGHTPIVVGDSSAVPYKGVLSLKPHPGMLDLTNQLSFEDTLVLCDQAQVFVSPDSGPVQLAGLTDIGIVGIYSTVPARCRLPFRHGLFAWRAAGVEPTCPHKGCYHLFLKDETQSERLQKAAREDLQNPGINATNTFMGDYCHLEQGKYRCLLEEITPERVWEACQGLLDTNWQAVDAKVARARASAAQGDGNATLDHLAQLPASLANPEVAHLRAHALALLGEWENSARAFGAVLAAFPNSEALNRMGLIFYANQRYEQCAQLFRKAHEWNEAFRPAQANGTYLEAKRCLESGDPLRGLLALELFKNLHGDLSPQEREHAFTMAEAQLLRGNLLVALAQLSEVSQAFERATELMPRTSPTGTEFMKPNMEVPSCDSDEVFKETVLAQATALAEEAGRMHAQGRLLETSQLVEGLVSAAAAFHRSGASEVAYAIQAVCAAQLPQDGAVQSLRTRLEGSVPWATCKICGRKAEFFGCADLGKSCMPEGSQFMPRACTYAAYHQCTFCGFLFTSDLDDWNFEDFESRIYNDDYVKVDPDFVDVRPQQRSEELASRLGAWGGILDILDYGGGSGILETKLRKGGFPSVATYDPFFHSRGDFAQKTYDLILSFEVFEHVPDPHRLMGDLVSFLRRDGVIFFTTLFQPKNLDELGISWWYLAPRNGHLSLYSRDSLRLLASAHGLRLFSVNDSTHVAFFTDSPLLRHLLKADEYRNLSPGL